MEPLSAIDVLRTVRACEELEIWKLVGQVAAFAFAALAFAVYALPVLSRIHSGSRRRCRLAFGLFTLFLTLYAGSKHIIGTITYPRTDVETPYLTNDGSYVTNDAVHVAFTRNIIVPSAASFYLERLALSYTNESDWANHAVLAYSNTFDRMSVPFDFACPAATNFNWIAYTDWVPSPTVHTNGVAYVAWQIGKATNDLVLYRTGVYTNSVRLAPDPAITYAPASTQP